MVKQAHGRGRARLRPSRAALGARAVAAVAGLVLDRLLGEPPRLHPVAGFGAAMRRLEAVAWRDSRTAGAVYAATGVAAAAVTGTRMRSVTLAVYLSVAGRALCAAATAVAESLASGDIESARRLLPALVGREASDLDEKEISRAVVESVAENTVDALVGPVFWAISAGAPGALGYRAANTLDAMVGRRDDRYSRFGWASARIDDLLGWAPARCTALLVACARPRSASTVLECVRRDAPAHPSPNAGVAEAAFAGALRLRLGGLNTYAGRAELRPPLGDGTPPAPGDIRKAVRLCEDVGRAVVVILLLAATPGGARALRSASRSWRSR